MILVEIELRRIQGFLFASPKLRDMVGANVMLGEAIRLGLTRKAIRHGSADLSAFDLQLPGADPEDPARPRAGEEFDSDDPAALARYGILAREGGHFRACFLDLSTAQAFCSDAQSFLLSQLPGLRFTIHWRDLAAGQFAHDQKVPFDEAVDHVQEDAIIAAPMFAVCSGLGSGRAVDTYRNEPVSDAVLNRRKAYEDFRNFGERAAATTGDVIGLMEPGLREHGRLPKDLKALCGREYMAVIHADGNSIGNAVKQIIDRHIVNDDASFLTREAAVEKFFFENRLAFRKAVNTALKGRFAGKDGDPKTEGRTRPYQLLMLGGDDLLMVCRARDAMRLVLEITQELKKLSGAPTIGVGVAIASPNVPFHHLNGLAETLTASAKRLYRCLEGERRPASVIDWHVETGSWSNDPLAQRRRHHLIVSETPDGREHCVTIQRPIPILPDAAGRQGHGEAEQVGPDLSCLNGLVDAAAELHAHRVARSQLRALVPALGRGRRLSTFTYRDAPSDLLKILGDTAKVGLQEPWRQSAPGCWITPIPDLVEIFEIDRLATAGRPTAEAS